MVKMVSIKKNSADKRAEKDAMGTRDILSVPAEDEGISVNLDHHHLMKMGVGGALKSGHKVELSGRGTVESSETRTGKDGERHSARLRLSHMGLDHDTPAEEGKSELRGEIEREHTNAESKRADRDATKETAKGRSDRKVAEG